MQGRRLWNLTFNFFYFISNNYNITELMINETGEW